MAAARPQERRPPAPSRAGPHSGSLKRPRLRPTCPPPPRKDPRTPVPQAGIRRPAPERRAPLRGPLLPAPAGPWLFAAPPAPAAVPRHLPRGEQLRSPPRPAGHAPARCTQGVAARRARGSSAHSAPCGREARARQAPAGPSHPRTLLRIPRAGRIGRAGETETEGWKCRVSGRRIERRQGRGHL